MRLFFAVPFPAEVRTQLQAFQRQLRETGVSGNFTRPENLHLTLAFLGETPRLREAARVLAAVDDLAFPLTVAGLGRFGDLLWAGVRPCPELVALAAGLQRRLREAGFSLEDRPFRPHVTLVRRAAGLAALPELPARTFSADRVVLMESLRADGRLVYRPQQERRLKG